MFSDSLVETRKPNCKWPGSIRRLLNEVVSISARTGLSVDHAIHSKLQTTDLYTTDLSHVTQSSSAAVRSPILIRFTKTLI